ncbi:MAG TPA: hypothetical protein ENJ18_13045 [Nannocystis exedens]|nr:hypothetical protein [Nannocystis exedens]
MDIVLWIVSGVLWLVVARFVYIGATAGGFALLRRYREYRVEKTGVSARARIVDVEVLDPGRGAVIDPSVDWRHIKGVLGLGATHRILVMVHPVGQEPFAADLYLRPSREQLDRLLPDAEVNVTYDPNDTDIVVLGGVSLSIEDSGAPPPT